MSRVSNVVPSSLKNMEKLVDNKDGKLSAFAWILFISTCIWGSLYFAGYVLVIFLDFAGFCEIASCSFEAWLRKIIMITYIVEILELLNISYLLLYNG